MGDSEVEHWMGGECGITTFVRGILPHPPYTSPQRGTPVFCDPGGDEDPVDSSYLKRKSSFSQDSCESHESDSEILPSNKRQRITVSAMRQLFAKFNLNDPEEATVSLTSQTHDPQNVSDTGIEPDTPQTPNTSTNKLKPTSEFETSDSSGEKVLDNSDVNDKVEGQQPVKRISTSEDSHVQNGKRQKVDNDVNTENEEDEDQNEEEFHQTKVKSCNTTEDTGGNEEKSEDDTSDEVVKASKRQVEVNDSDAEGNGENSNKVKRTRRLRRGLRLCTNITCYIEQVLYN
ncbi:hypothetical protein Pmani_023215 [Petrolisthes manimaculis]|uniref:Uncharacterized protein n=1 Tax=Petrolisthes manimaculis TaxID=1843537 RepID=A0AAE1PAI6_9EUCA|nr:hypothetical protein Pmani_023215 [Petrolisthes manimaculis]